MKIRELIDMDGTNATGQRISLLNPEKPRSYSTSSAPQVRPLHPRRQEFSSFNVRERYNSSDFSGYREPTLNREYSTASSNSSTNSMASASTSSSNINDRSRHSLTPPTPDLMDTASPYDEDCTPSPYPHRPPFSFADSYRQNSTEPALHTRLLDLTVRGRQDASFLPTPSPSAHSLPSFGQAFSDYIISPQIPTSYEREAHNSSPKSYFGPPSHLQRPPLRVDVQLSNKSVASSTLQHSPATPSASSDDSLPKQRPPLSRKSLSARTSSAARGPSERHRYPCPLADEYDCRSYFTTSGHASRHAKKHTGKRDAECPECHRCFTRKDNMEQHRRTHSKEGKKKKMEGKRIVIPT